MSHELPDRPWEKIGLDFLTFKEKDYLICNDNESNFLEIDHLPKTNTTTVKAKIKVHFAIPDTMVSGNANIYAPTPTHPHNYA